MLYRVLYEVDCRLERSGLHVDIAVQQDRTQRWFVAAQVPSELAETSRKRLIYSLMILAAPACDWLASEGKISRAFFPWLLLLCIRRNKVLHESYCGAICTWEHRILTYDCPTATNARLLVFFLSLSEYRCFSAVLFFLCDLAPGRIHNKTTL